MCHKIRHLRELLNRRELTVVIFVSLSKLTILVLLFLFSQKKLRKNEYFFKFLCC